MSEHELHNNRFLTDEEQSKVIENFIEIELPNEDSFLKIKETLTRIGLKSRRRDSEKPKLFQSCHILHKRGKHYIVHFKELFMLDGKKTNMSEEDLQRRNTIASMLENWGLCSIVDKYKLTPMFDDIQEALNTKKIVVIPFKVKEKFDLEPKYNLGKFHSKKA